MHAWKQIFKILLFLLLISLALNGANWTHITVGSAPASTRPVICSDPRGNLHIAWTSDNPYGESLQYANNLSGFWNFQKKVAGSSGNQAYNPSITADQQGYAYIVARFYGYSYQIKYLTNREITGNYWSSTIQMGSGHYHESSIEVDSKFRTHVFAQEDTWGSNVFYQNLDLNDVVIEGGTSQFFASAIDQNDILHFVGSHADGTWYTFDSSGTWSNPVTIDQVNISAYHPSITCDGNNVLHVVFASIEGIYYLNNSAGSWSIPELTTTAGIFPNVVADENSKAHIAYYTAVESGGLFYTNNIKGAWLTPEYITTINTDYSSATEDAAHVESKIALSPTDNTVNIVFISNNTDIKVARTGDFNLRRVKSTDATSTLISTAETPTLDTLSTSTSGSIDMLQFTINDIGSDGNATKIKQLLIQRGPGMSNEICFNDIFGDVTINVSDGSTLNGNIFAAKILFGTLSSVTKEILESGSLNFTVSATLKQPLQNVDGKTVQMKINGLYDVIIDTTGSRFDYNSISVLSDTILFQVVPDHFEFANLGDDFYNENLIQGFWMQVKVVDANGSIATGVTGINVTLSAVELNGVTPTTQPLQSTEGLTKTLTGGIAQWNNITFPEHGQIRILASCDVLTAASDTVTVMPFHKNLVITSDEDLKAALKSLNIEADYYSEWNYQFPTAAKIADYESLLLFPSSSYAWYIDSTKIKTFLAAGSDTARKSILAFGEYGLGYNMDTPFANNYFGARGNSYFDHQTTNFEGVTGDPVTHGLSLSASAYMTTELLFNDNLKNSIILTQTGTGKVVGVKNAAGSYRTLMITPEFSILSTTADRDTMFSRIMQWFQEEVQTIHGPELSGLPDINMTEDIPYKMAITDWYPFVDDTDTPDENLNWYLNHSSHSVASVKNDTLIIQPEKDYYGEDTMLVAVSDGQSLGSDTIIINIAAVNDPPSSFSLLTPENGYWTEDNHDSSKILFTWTQANDIDNDSVVYQFKLKYQNNESKHPVVNDTFLIIDYYWGDIFIPMNEEIMWIVTAHDEQDSTVAQNAPFVFEISETESIDNRNNQIPDKFILYANYPNPFNPETTIKYGLPEESFVTVSIFDINGRQVQTLIQETQVAGYHSVQWDATNVGSGVYFYRIVAGIFQEVRKCVLIK
ncbi:T9SS type A sorting domain-containing protein [bacterium]|nr:T9SS type A sorting domain-containing protein [bacterium]MBU1065189.1 T9SS type A sorting domain-containing protein [bacterium]MBU1635173.1 T9SS type A sorting domain-containing protein [bacterium]MBU1872690.1 T9SS type A sorting domain-containing protein [bacterium]